VQAGIVPKLSATPGAIRHTGPETGADTVDVLRELGLDEERIRQLLRARVVATAAGSPDR
jgi:crotonobetainyl-CoA:carnitine CoA-transferase CaiB-like acyl-CoA transferase